MTDSYRLAFRLPRSAYLVVIFLTMGATAVFQHPALAVVYVIPLAAAFFIARTATLVDADGITVRALFGQTRLPWNEIRGVQIDNRNRIYAALDDGAVRLPCVRLGDLWAISEASGGHLPHIDKPTPKYAPARRRR